MAQLKKRYCFSVYVDDERIARKIERAAKIEGRSTSNFIANAADKAADEALEERKRLAAERQLGEVSAQ